MVITLSSSSSQRREGSVGRPVALESVRESTHITAVVVLLMPGDSARNAMSTICLMPQPESCSTVRWRLTPYAVCRSATISFPGGDSRASEEAWCDGPQTRRYDDAGRNNQ